MVNVFPMIEDGKTIGAIDIYTAGSPVVCDDDLIEHISDMAMNDHLTGLPNRRYLESYLELKFNELSHFNRPFAVMCLDFDEFGACNNSCGSDIGDTMLKSVAASIQ